MSEDTRSFKMRLELRRKNARLVAAREEVGLTQKQLSERLGINQADISGFETMRVYPSPRVAEVLAEFVGCSVEELFPPELREVAKTKGSVNPIVREVDIAPMKLIGIARASNLLASGVPSPETDLVREAESEVLAAAIGKLRPFEGEVIRRFYGIGQEKMTGDQLGAHFNLSTGRIGKVIQETLGKIRTILRREMGRTPSLDDFSTMLDT